ncbi:type I-E CRISPR-associated endonuclease Cas1e [Arcanobacterium canis]
MAYSEEALAFSTIPASHQVRLEDRLSFLYLEYCLIRQDRTGVIAIQNDDRNREKDTYREGEETQPSIRRLQLPVAGLGVLCLGPGTSISNAAITSCTRSGCTVIFTGGGAVNAYAHATALTSSAKWAIAQARLISNERYQIDAARKFYKRQFCMDTISGESISVMRGMEGRLMRNTYREEAKRAGIRGFKRDTQATDPVNSGLNIANSILYGASATVCTAIGVNPALGIIHRGDVRALIYDLADLYKASMVIPLVFSHAKDEDPLTSIRRHLRQQIHSKKVMVGMLEALMDVLSPHLPDRNDDRLIDDDGEVDGHIQYGKEIE